MAMVGGDAPKLIDVAGKYIDMLPLDLRDIAIEILSKTYVNLSKRVMAIDDVEVNIPNSHDALIYATEILLHRSGYASKLGKYLPKMTFLIVSALLDMIDIEKPKPELSVEIKHITEREELYYSIVEQIMSKYTIKTFYISSSEREYILGIYCYDGLAYRSCETEIEGEIERLVSKSREISIKTTRWVVREAMDKIRRKTLEKLRYEPLTIAFENTVFNWEKFLETGSIRESIVTPGPDIVVFHRIPHKLRIDLLEKLEGLLKYDERLVSNIEELASKLCPKALKAFKDWVGDKWILLFEIIGYTLYPKYDMHKAIMLVGEGRNGKSTYLRLIKDILGPWNVSSISLQDLTDESKRFTIAQLYHKLANIYPDIPDRPLTHTGRFKILTGEDTITADRKFRDPITFVNYAKLLFSANELPPVADMTIAFWRRWLVIEFPNQFEIDQTFYERTFTENEIEGVIIVSLLAFRNAWLRKKFSYEETDADYKELWLRETNSVYSFIQDLLSGKIEGYRAEKIENERVEASLLYRIYIDYCNNEDREPLDKRRFTIEMERLGFRKVKVKTKTYYKGLKLTSPGQEALFSE